MDQRFTTGLCKRVRRFSWRENAAALASTEHLPCERIAMSAQAIPYQLARAPDDFLAPPCLVWIREHSIWESSENLGLFLNWACGATGSDVGDTSDDIPAGFLFDRGDLRRIAEPLFMALCFGWGVSVLMEGRDAAVNVDHHSHLWVSIDSPGEEAWARDFIAIYTEKPR
jgi:hypothetical protein